MKREKTLKLKVSKKTAKAYSESEKSALVTSAQAAPRSKSVYPQTMLGLHAGLRDKEIRTLRWEQLDLNRNILVVGETKTDAGTGRRIPINSELREALDSYSRCLGLQVLDSFGSSGRIRTYNPSVNSRMLYR